MNLIIYLSVLIIILFLIYAIVPTIYLRLTGSRIIKTFDSKKQIALTFDDGPNQAYTTRLLTLLKKYNVQATFFVVGRKLEAHREIVEQMSADGHTIGIHHYNHTSNWLLTPSALKKQVKKTERAIKKITNKDVLFYRPPWGHFNLCTHRLVDQYHIVMWSHLYKDWKTKTGQTTLLKKLRATPVNGSILLLHDCGETLGADNTAPHYMINALEVYLRESIQKGIQFISLQEVTGQVENRL